MDKKRELLIRLTVIFSICLIIAISIYFSAGVAGFEKFWDAIGPTFLGSLISFLFGFLIWGWLDKLDRGQELKIIQNEISVLHEKIETLSKVIKQVNEKSETDVKIYNIVNEQHKRVRNLIFHIRKSTPFVNRYYTAVLSSYHGLFSVEDNGFKISDEYLSLISYVTFWKYMLEKQKDLKREAEENNINPHDNCLVARVVHSNSIDIWTNEHDKYKEFTNQLLDLQKEFIENKGIVVRVFLGPYEKPNDKYKLAMQKMTENNIESKYLQQTQFNKLPYDFLVMFDEQFAYQWYSDTIGDSLASTMIRDFVMKRRDFLNEEIIQKWDYLFNYLKRSGDPITSIPPTREYHLELNYISNR